MNRFDIPLIARGLTTYAIERQHGCERHLASASCISLTPPQAAGFAHSAAPPLPIEPAAPSFDGGPVKGSTPWAEQRRLWIDAILQGMARLDGEQPDPKLMEQFDLELEQARGCYFIVPAARQMQKDVILELRRFVAALEASGDDRRRQVAVVGDLLEDMSTHRSWGLTENGLSRAMEETESALVRMTAQMPIRFTRILLGGDAGPHWASGFVPGAVTDDGAVRRSQVYQDAVRDHPEVQSWPALCTVYVGRDLPSAHGTVDASGFDLEIMNRTGDRFLREQGVHCVGGPCQLTIAAAPEITAPGKQPQDGCGLEIPAFDMIRVLRIEPGVAPEIITVPNTLSSLQTAVGGDIEALGLDCGVCLICNEEGKLLGLPANRQVGGDIIAGTFLIVGEADGEFCSLSDADAAHYAKEFAQPLLSQSAPEAPSQWEFYVF